MSIVLLKPELLRLHLLSNASADIFAFSGIFGTINQTRNYVKTDLNIHADCMKQA